MNTTLRLELRVNIYAPNSEDNVLYPCNVPP